MKKYREALAGYQLAIQISSILLCSVFGSLFGGIWLDRQLSTTPWLMLIFMVAGIVGGTYTIYRTVKASQK